MTCRGQRETAVPWESKLVAFVKFLFFLSVTVTTTHSPANILNLFSSGDFLSAFKYVQIPYLKYSLHSATLFLSGSILLFSLVYGSNLRSSLQYLSSN